MKPYERLLGDALQGDTSLFARYDSVEEAWRVVEPILGSSMLLAQYDPNTWGPPQVNNLIADAGDWSCPETHVKLGLKSAMHSDQPCLLSLQLKQQA